MNSCCLLFWSFITAIVCITLVSEVTFFVGADMCFDDFRRCGFGFGFRSSRFCRRRVCAGGTRWTTRPFDQDKLPPPQIDEFGSGNGTEAFSGAGDGSPDYWSIYVAVFCGTAASIITIIGACGGAFRRGGAHPLCVSFSIFSAGMLHLAAVVSLGIQFFTSKEQTVYNLFRSEQYFEIDDTLYSYLINDSFLDEFASRVGAAFFFCLTSAIWEILFTLCILLPSDAKAEQMTNVSWATHVSQPYLPRQNKPSDEVPPAYSVA